MGKVKTREFIAYFSLFLLYIFIRCIAWNRTFILEDHDSVSYLSHIRLFENLDFKKIVELNPDFTPLYPFFGSLCTVPGWSPETGARLCSLLFSLLLFLALMQIGKRLGDWSSVLIGLLILSFNPILVFFSISVITEPSYVALIYLGLWLFMTQYENPSLWKASLLGVILGLAFLDRTEGILYLCIFPFFQVIHFLFQKAKKYNFKRVIQWSLIYSVLFAATIAPQIFIVSHKMGHFAINGRQAWEAILNDPDQKSYEAKLNGLDFSPSQVNLRYVQSHPEAMRQFGSTQDLEYYYDFVKKVIFNLDDLFLKRLPVLIGVFGIVFFTFGLISVYQRGNLFQIALILSFIALNLVAPLIKDVDFRHIAVIVPIILLVEGIGVIFLYRKMKLSSNYGFVLSLLVIIMLVFHLSIGSAYPLLKRLNTPPKFSWDYDPCALKEPIRIIKEAVKNNAIVSPKIATRKTYIAYYSGIERVAIPYTTYKKLVNYCYLNNVHFLFLEYRLLSKHPFLPMFLKNAISGDFILLYGGKDHWGQRVELYRFKNTDNFFPK